MQILREALLQKLSTSIILFKVLRNKILCLTEFQLIVLSIDEGCKKVQIPYSGTNVWNIEMSKDYIAILQRSGNLEIRRLDNIKEVVLTQKNIKISNVKYPKLKWWEDDIHVIYQKKYDEINLLNKQFSSHSLPFELKRQQSLVQLEFCDLFPGLKNIFYVISSSIHMFLNGFKLGAIDFQNQEIKQVLRLCHPLQANEFKKQYFVVLTESREGKSEKRSFLKVYNVLNMSLIFSKELMKQNDQQIEISCDELCEYLLVKYLKGKTSKSVTIESQNLMKINGDYYFSQNPNYFEDYEPFFFFDILIGLKRDLKLFPSHSEKIKGKLCNSIDTCYFENNQIFIASVVLEASYKDQIFKTYKQIEIITTTQQSQNETQTDVVMWRQIVEAKVNPQSFIDKIVKSICLRNPSKPEMETSFGVDIGIEQERIIQDLLSNLSKINKFSPNDFEKAYLTIKKIVAIEYFPMLMDVASMEKDSNKTSREILEKSNEDFTNTMSGFSSSQPHSPRSIQSSGSCQQKKFLFKDVSKELSITDAVKEDQFFCRQCTQIQDHENLQLISFIEEQCSEKAQKALTKIEEQIYQMENLCKSRLERMEIKTIKDKKTEQNVISLINNEFQTSLKSIQLNLMRSAQTLTEKIIHNTQFSIEKQKSANQYAQKLEDTRLKYENELKIHKESKEELLDYLYDIEFPDLGIENYQLPNFSSSLSQSKTGNSMTKIANKNKDEMAIQKNQSQEFKLFSDFVLKNFI